MDDHEVKLDHWQVCKHGAGLTTNDNQTQEVMSEHQGKTASPTGYAATGYQQKVRVSYT